MALISKKKLLSKEQSSKENTQQHTTKLHRLLLDKYYYNPNYSQYIPHDYTDINILLKAKFDTHKKVKDIISE